MNLEFTSERRETIFGWSRTVKVGDQEYAVSVRRGKSVRIAFRGNKRGWQWFGSVYRIHGNEGHVWTDRVPGSIGCRGLLIEAGVLDMPVKHI